MPQTVLGVAESENDRSPPVRMIDSGRDVRSVAWPSTLRPLMYSDRCVRTRPGRRSGWICLPEADYERDRTAVCSR